MCFRDKINKLQSQLYVLLNSNTKNFLLTRREIYQKIFQCQQEKQFCQPCYKAKEKYNRWTVIDLSVCENAFETVAKTEPFSLEVVYSIQDVSAKCSRIDIATDIHLDK